MDTGDELDELKIDDKLDELLCPVEKCNLAAVRRVNFIYDVNDNDLDMELCTARFLDALLHLQMLQLSGQKEAVYK